MSQVILKFITVLISFSSNFNICSIWHGVTLWLFSSNAWADLYPLMEYGDFTDEFFSSLLGLGPGIASDKAVESTGPAFGSSAGLTGITVDKSVEFSYEELAKATDNFNLANKIGQGGFGSVYYAELRGEVCGDACYHLS